MIWSSSHNNGFTLRLYMYAFIMDIRQLETFYSWCLIFAYYVDLVDEISERVNQKLVLRKIIESKAVTA